MKQREEQRGDELQLLLFISNEEWTSDRGKISRHKARYRPRSRSYLSIPLFNFIRSKSLTRLLRVRHRRTTVNREWKKNSLLILRSQESQFLEGFLSFLSFSLIFYFLTSLHGVMYFYFCHFYTCFLFLYIFYSFFFKIIFSIC